MRAVAHREPVRGVRDGRDDRRLREPVDGRGQGAGLDLDLQQQRDGPSEHPLRALPADPAPLGRPPGLVLRAQLQRERLALPALGLLPGRVRAPGDQLRGRPHVVLGLGLRAVHELGRARVGRARVAGVGVAEERDVVLLRPQDGGLGVPRAGVEDGDERARRRAEVLEVAAPDGAATVLDAAREVDPDEVQLDGGSRAGDADVGAGEDRAGVPLGEALGVAPLRVLARGAHVHLLHRRSAGSDTLRRVVTASRARSRPSG